MEGTIIDGKYEVIRQLGQGGMGAVYEARHRATGRRVALKVIVPSALAAGPDIIARFQREARASGAIDSPFVVQVTDAGVDAQTGAPYMAMECLSGEDVQALVARLGPLPPDVVLRITAQACHGLSKAHESGIVHRDIKSANLFLAKREGDSDELVTKILDFGIAKVRANAIASDNSEDHKLTKTGSMLGSPVYMSPEQAIGSSDLDARSDVFSMGVMMYEALSGVTPNGHVQSLGALIMAICAKPATPIQDRAPWVSADIAKIVHKALATKPEDRYQTAAELRAAALALLSNGSAPLTSDMVVALPAELRDTRAARVESSKDTVAFDDTVVPTSQASTPSVDPPVNALANTQAASIPPGHTTTAGFGNASDIPPPMPRARRGPAIAVAGVAAMALIGIGYFKLFARSESTQPAALVAASVAMSAAPSVDSAAAAASASSQATPSAGQSAIAASSAGDAGVAVTYSDALKKAKQIASPPPSHAGAAQAPVASARVAASVAAPSASPPPAATTKADRNVDEFGLPPKKP
jgi:serine/threonine-protein kinase